jgi:hypothetical protein
MLITQASQVPIKRDDLDAVEGKQLISHPLASEVFVSRDQYVFGLRTPFGNDLVGRAALSVPRPWIIGECPKNAGHGVLNRIKGVCHPEAQAGVQAELSTVSRRRRRSP